MGLVWLVCVVLLDVNVSYGHATPLYQAYIEVRRTNFLQSVLSPPLSLFSASQRTHGAHRLFAHMRPHVSVKTQEDPLNLHIFHLDVMVMKKNTR